MYVWRYSTRGTTFAHLDGTKDFFITAAAKAIPVGSKASPSYLVIKVSHYAIPVNNPETYNREMYSGIHTYTVVNTIPQTQYNRANKAMLGLIFINPPV